jgi:hypothetical protein
VAGVLPAAVQWILQRLQGAQAAPDRLQPTTSGNPPTTGRRAPAPRSQPGVQPAPQGTPLPDVIPGEPAPQGSVPDVVPGEPPPGQRPAPLPPNYPPVPNGGVLLPQPLIDQILRDLRIPIPPGLEAMPGEAGG